MYRNILCIICVGFIVYILICNSGLTCDTLDILGYKMISPNNSTTKNIDTEIPYFYIYDSPILSQFLNDTHLNGVKFLRINMQLILIL